MRPAGRALSPGSSQPPCSCFVECLDHDLSTLAVRTCGSPGQLLGEMGAARCGRRVDNRSALRTFKYMPAVSLTAVTVSPAAVTEAVVAQPHPLLPIPAYLERHLPDEVVGSVFGDDFHRELEHHVADQLDPDAVLADRLDRFLEQEVPAIDYCAGELLRPTNDVG